MKTLTLIDRLIDNPLILSHYLGYDKVSHDIHKDWILDILTPGNSCIQGHRHSYKTTCIVVGVILLLWVNPEVTILIVRKSDHEAKKIFLEIQKHLESDIVADLFNEVYRIDSPVDWNSWSTKEGLNLILKTRPSKERNLEYAGLGKAKTGAHYDLIIADDIVNLDDRVHNNERERTKLYTKDFRNLLNIDGIGIKYRGTPWHRNDLFSELEKIMEVQKYPVSMNFIPDLTKDILDEIKRDLGSDSWYACNFELKHISDEGQVFSDPKIIEEHFSKEEVIDIYKNMVLKMYVDPAFGGRDWTAVCIGGLWDGKIIVVYGKCWRVNIMQATMNIYNTYKEQKGNKLFIEDNGAQKALLMNLQERGLIPEGITNTENKHVRIIQTVGKNWDNIYFNKTVDLVFLNQILDYEIPDDYGRRSDIDSLDSLSGLISVLNHKSGKIKQWI